MPFIRPGIIQHRFPKVNIKSEWMALELRSDLYGNGPNRLLCVRKHLLDCKPYHSLTQKITWKASDLHKWLNSEFYHAVFTKEEQRRIVFSDVYNPGNDTQDHNFLLSYEEVVEHFEFENFCAEIEERRTKTTPFWRSRGLWFLDDPYDRCHNYVLVGCIALRPGKVIQILKLLRNFQVLTKFMKI